MSADRHPPFAALFTARFAAHFAAALLCLSGAAHAFPEGASTPTAAELTERLSGKVFRVELKNGMTWRLQFMANGYFFVDTSAGGRLSGTWRTEDGRVCSHIPDRDPSCGDARLHEGIVHVRRADGEVIRYVPR